MNNSSTENSQPPQQKEKKEVDRLWLYFIIALPLSAVLASLTTVYIAFKYADSRVYESHKKDGKSVIAGNRDLRANAAQLQVALKLDVRRASNHTLLSIEIDGTHLQAPFELYLAHKTLANKDISIVFPNSSHRSPQSMEFKLSDYKVSLKGTSQEGLSWLLLPTVQASSPDKEKSRTHINNGL